MYMHMPAVLYVHVHVKLYSVHASVCVCVFKLYHTHYLLIDGIILSTKASYLNSRLLPRQHNETRKSLHNNKQMLFVPDTRALTFS